MSDPVVRRVMRSVEDARNVKGMVCGMPKVTIDASDAERLCLIAEAARAQQPNLSRIAQKKLDQMGATVHGALVKNEAGAWAAVSDSGRVMWLDDFEGKAGRAQGGEAVACPSAPYEQTWHDYQDGFCAHCGKQEPLRCRGKNCSGINGVGHSAECEAEHAATVGHPHPSASVPDDLRAAGLTVAVHNDYRLDGEPHTFWLFTDPAGMSYKGEGRTDAESLNAVRALLSTTPRPASDSAPWRLAMKRLVFAARTSGGTAGADEELQNACSACESLMNDYPEEDSAHD